MSGSELLQRQIVLAWADAHISAWNRRLPIIVQFLKYQSLLEILPSVQEKSTQTLKGLRPLLVTVTGRAHFLPEANNSVRFLRLGGEVKITMDFSDMPHETAAFLTRTTTYNHCVRLRLCPDLRQVVLGVKSPLEAGVVVPPHPHTSSLPSVSTGGKILEDQLLGFIMTLTSAQLVNIALVISWWELNQLAWSRSETPREPSADCSASHRAKIEPKAAPVLWSPLFFFSPCYFSNLILRLCTDNDITMVFVVRLAARNVSLNLRLRVPSMERGAKMLDSHLTPRRNRRLTS